MLSPHPDPLPAFVLAVSSSVAVSSVSVSVSAPCPPPPSLPHLFAAECASFLPVLSQRISCAKLIKRFVLHAKKTAFVVEHDFIMATYLADRVIVYDGEPGIEVCLVFIYL